MKKYQFNIDPALATAAEIEELASRRDEIVSLDLSPCLKLAEADLAPLAKLTELVELRLPACLLTDAGFAYLTPLKNLKKLDLSRCDFTDEETEQIAELSSLEELNLSGCKYITDEGIIPLARLKNLKRLNLESCCFDVSVLRPLMKLKNLEELKLENQDLNKRKIEKGESVPITEKMAAKLTQMLPKAKIRFNSKVFPIKESAPEAPSYYSWLKKDDGVHFQYADAESRYNDAEYKLLYPSQLSELLVEWSWYGACVMTSGARTKFPNVLPEKFLTTVKNLGLRWYAYRLCCKRSISPQSPETFGQYGMIITPNVEFLRINNKMKYGPIAYYNKSRDEICFTRPLLSITHGMFKNMLFRDRFAAIAEPFEAEEFLAYGENLSEMWGCGRFFFCHQNYGAMIRSIDGTRLFTMPKKISRIAAFYLYQTLMREEESFDFPDENDEKTITHLTYRSRDWELRCRNSRMNIRERRALGEIVP